MAANGLGMVLAEKGTLDQAKDVFARVREVSAEVLGDVWINLAHVYLAQNKHNEVRTIRRDHGTQGSCCSCSIDDQLHTIRVATRSIYIRGGKCDAAHTGKATKDLFVTALRALTSHHLDFGPASRV